MMKTGTEEAEEAAGLVYVDPEVQGHAKRILALTGDDEGEMNGHALALPESRAKNAVEADSFTKDNTGITEGSPSESVVPSPPALSPGRRHAAPGAYSIPGIQAEDTRSASDCSLSTASNDPDDGELSRRINNENTVSLRVPFEASVVGEDEERTLPRQKSSEALMESLEEAMDVRALPERKPREKTGPGVVILGIAAVVILVALIALVVSIRPDQAEPAAAAEPRKQSTSQPTYGERQRYPPFDDHLYPSTLKAIREDPSSPQYKANEWMWNDPIFLESYPRWRQIQRFSMVLQYMYFSMEGDNWYRNNHWLSHDVHECQWYSNNEQPCEEERLVVQDLKANNLRGTLPIEVQLETVRYLDYSHNDISGPMPHVVHANKAEVIILSNNSIGKVPNELSPPPITTDGGIYFPERKIVKLDRNLLVFPSLKWLQQYPNLEILNLTQNRNAGTLPTTELHTNTKLQFLGLGHNAYAGSIPTDLALLTALTGLDLSGNMAISGSIPQVLSTLEHLQHLDVSETSITGMIPLGLCDRSTRALFSIDANCSQVQCC
ncbi:Leucine rich repeat N-terminal domain [Seminavis robusta]|uniref:Leucine rich repeat N-terminal domain n=1 Tax=Seminavis robusta TaxID=568900 RepID=A0A9N8D7A4_9STRA|nr:Leucine rich repeat N-terminal domain [Seminavis robusta]|eukprot:Sro6_g005160.1 Leucine rich repeat N-terminal domain (551) ;mRNA; f:115343-116995